MIPYLYKLYTLSKMSIDT